LEAKQVGIRLEISSIVEHLGIDRKSFEEWTTRNLCTSAATQEREDREAGSLHQAIGTNGDMIRKASFEA
jgi:hypothetical protein